MKYLPYNLNSDELVNFTPSWGGERSEDGRPYVSDEILDILEKHVSITFAWGILKNQGFLWQYITGFQSTYPERKMVGRALTSTYAPLRPDLRTRMVDQGEADGRVGDMISWPIDQLESRDVYVADVFGKLDDGPIVGERLSAAIFANSQNGAIHSSSIRDWDAIERIEDFNIYHLGHHPSHASPVSIMLLGINCPINLMGVTVMPGDIILAEGGNVIFIPPHLAETVAYAGLIENYKDRFSVERLQQHVYKPGELDREWTKEIEEDFKNWLDSVEDAPFTYEDMQKLDVGRTW